MFRFVLLCASVSLVHCGFFDLTDVEDPLALLWNMKPIHQKLSECKIDNNRQGTCMDKAKCILSGGTPTGHCGLIFTCCSYETNCLKTTDKKQSYFNSGNLNSAVTNCKYTIKLRNKNVCQVRLDFEQLILAPTILTAATTQSSGSVDVFTCAKDSLTVNPNTYGVPVLCGNSSNQHLYIHVNQSADPNSAVNIDINLADRSNSINQYLPKPSWKIKFTQLECPLQRHKFDFAKYGEIENINKDFNMLAPQGAVQYFTEPRGEIRSIGYNNSEPQKLEEKTSYPYLEHYSIAFRRPSHVCGIQFTPVEFNLLTNDNQGTTSCSHYLYVPEYFAVDGSQQLTENNDKICTGDNSFYKSHIPTWIHCLTPGPIYIHFKSMDTTTSTDQILSNQRFLMKYDLLTSGCPYNSN